MVYSAIAKYVNFIFNTLQKYTYNTVKQLIEKLLLVTVIKLCIIYYNLIFIHNFRTFTFYNKGAINGTLH
ncbi:hypothetical protein AM493_01610 [Flavobacterium akiainvivens]|uniref:Uncharacterized protein n=1 Tax=Flavobacterium akiainvivens TaxID=1202724 RepID=A0A0M8MF03_9FLAO|nr:hypothetical protein AM493_01610 [Flavobacterium akiainvivens]